MVGAEIGLTFHSINPHGLSIFFLTQTKVSDSAQGGSLHLVIF